MEKGPTISYKVYSNEHLKKVLFHGQEMYPLYIQVIHDRRPIYFKSYFFDLFSQEKYALHYIGGKRTPAQNEIIAKEESVIKFLIEQQKLSFNLDAFQKEYYYHSRDLLNLLDDRFKDYLVTFFEDQGHPQLARLIASGRKTISSANLLHGFGSALKPPLFKLLLGKCSLLWASFHTLTKLYRKKKEPSPFTLFRYMNGNNPKRNLRLF